MVGDDNYCHRGIGKKALKYIINYGFRKIGLQKITLGVFERNRTAKNVLNQLVLKWLVNCVATF
jgi:RimJ/RimL family protein N-acetyltransferase